MVKLFMLDGTLRLGAIQGLFKFVLEFIWVWFRVGYNFFMVGSVQRLVWSSFRVSLGSMWGWCRVYLG